MRAASDGPAIFWRASKKRWVCKYKARDGKFAQKLCPAEYTKSMRREARDWARGWLESSDAKEREPVRRGEGIGLRTAYERWIAIVEKCAERGELAPSTIGNYRSDFAAHILSDADLDEAERIADRGVAELGTNYARLTAWYRAARARCTSASRARSVFSTFRVFFDEATVQRWFFGANPFRNKALVKLLPELPTKREKPPIVVPLEQAQALILGRRGPGATIPQLDLLAGAPSASVVPVAWRVRYVLAFTSGDRDGELSGLTWGSLFLDDKIPVMEVDRARRMRRQKNEERGPLKSRSSSRTMPLHPAAVAALRWWSSAPEGVEFLLGRPPGPTDPVFPSERGGTTGAFARPRSAEKTRAHLEALGYPTTGAKGRNVDMHATRRTFLTLLERAGVPEHLRKVLAGHGIADVQHRHYTADDEAKLRELADAVALIRLRWDDPTPISTAGGGGGRGARLVPSRVPGVVPAVTTSAGGTPAMTGSDKTLSGVLGATRTRDLRFRNSLSPGASSTQQDSESRPDAGVAQPDNGWNANNGRPKEPSTAEGTTTGVGFAIGAGPLPDATADASHASGAASPRATGVRHTSGDGRAQEVGNRARRGRATPRSERDPNPPNVSQGESGPALKKAADGLEVQRRTWDGFDAFQRAAGDDEEDGRG